MKNYFMGFLILVALILGLNSCEKNDVDILQIRWGIVEDGIPSAGNANLAYYALKDAYDAVGDACMKCGGANYVKSDAVDQAMINFVARKEIQEKMSFISSDAKNTIETLNLGEIWSNRTFRIEYRFGNQGDWQQAYEYTYPHSNK